MEPCRCCAANAATEAALMRCSVGFGSIARCRALTAASKRASWLWRKSPNNDDDDDDDDDEEEEEEEEEEKEAAAAAEGEGVPNVESSSHSTAEYSCIASDVLAIDNGEVLVAVPSGVTGPSPPSPAVVVACLARPCRCC